MLTLSGIKPTHSFMSIQVRFLPLKQFTSSHPMINETLSVHFGIVEKVLQTENAHLIGLP